MKTIDQIRESTYEMLEELQKELKLDTMDELLNKIGNQYIEQRQ